ncbi:CBS domain-containing protein [Candidatus Woesearchaeota archaeon]|nr:MAG: CBS domain-containing protein [Candidatus Woesearchaeota archaeon]
MINDPREIKLIRRQLGITQSELAKKSGVSQSLIAKIESGRLDPSFTKVKKISETLEILRNERQKKVREIMVTRIISAKPEMAISEAIKKMKKHNISQMPVIEQGVAVGLISETSILEALAENKPHRQVKDVMSDAPPLIPEEATVETATAMLAHYPLVLVSKKGKIKGLVTRSDVLQKAFR